MRAISVPTVDEIESVRRMIRESWSERERALRGRMAAIRQEQLAERLRDEDGRSGPMGSGSRTARSRRDVGKPSSQLAEAGAWKGRRSA
jgi:hypothetical protein